MENETEVERLTAALRMTQVSVAGLQMELTRKNIALDRIKHIAEVGELGVAEMAGKALAPTAATTPSEKPAMDFVEALAIANGVFDQYKADQLKWWKRMDGTPILNDVAVRMAMAFKDEAAAPSEGRDAVRNVGAMMANVMFNYARKAGEVISEHDAGIFGKLQKQWDEAIAATTSKPEGAAERQCETVSGGNLCIYCARPTDGSGAPCPGG